MIDTITANDYNEKGRSPFSVLRSPFSSLIRRNFSLSAIALIALALAGILTGCPMRSDSVVITSNSGGVGVGTTLTADTSGLRWGASNSIAYQWMRGDTRRALSGIAGAAAQTYTLTADDLGQYIAVEVTLRSSNGGQGAANTARSAVVGPVTDGSAAPAPQPAPGQVTAPTASPAPGRVGIGTTVTLMCSTAGAAIYYTINGDTPTGSSIPYSSPINITVATTIRAIAVKDGIPDSTVLTAAYALYSLGDTGPGGGKIFYISTGGFTMTDTNTTAHYLEAAPAAISGARAWASGVFTGSSIAGTESTIGAGRKNTTLILATDATAPAARACADYANNGKTDWFLPSRSELTQLYTNRTYVTISGTPEYWSSTEAFSSAVYTLNLGAAQPQNATGTKSNSSSIIAYPVRAF